jgi:hypothetical protein
MKSLKTAVKIWKKEIEFKFIVWNIPKETRLNYRKRRQEWIRGNKRMLTSDLLNRHRIGDIILQKEDLEKIQKPQNLLVFREVEEIYKKYL